MVFFGVRYSYHELTLVIFCRLDVTKVRQLLITGSPHIPWASHHLRTTGFSTPCTPPYSQGMVWFSSAEISGQA